ncbi:hypothetical protein [Brevibacillus porteri]|uniref:hypothetical protein n=1 Tax=Brevibacillus porteri TaxID=2126350 RepID=UPI00370BCD5A
MKVVKRNRKKDIEVYYRENRYWDLLKRTKKYKDLYQSKEAFVSLLISFITVFFLLHVLLNKNTIDFFIWFHLTAEDKVYIENTINLLRSLLPTIIGGYFSLLGFLVGALAIITGTLGNKVMSNIVDDGKIKHMMSIIFNFYFSGSLMGVALTLLILSYLSTFTAIPLNAGVFIVWSILVCFVVYFSIIYSIMLLGTCIRLFLLGYKYFDEEQTGKRRYKISSIDKKRK